MRKTYLAWALMVSAAATHALANGGGYARGGVTHTGDVVGFEPSATEHIQILDEKLHIRAGKKQASVEVRYLMRNVTNQRVKVRFGFPIEETVSKPDGFNRTKITPPKEPAYCRNYQITAAGKPLKVTWQAEKNEEDDTRFKKLSGWNISELTFAAGQEIPVMIRFDSGYAESYSSVSESSYTSAAIFRYRLSTAAVWHGPIVRGRIVIEPDGIHPDDIRIIKPVNRFKKVGTRWIWDFENLDPTLDDDLEIECQPAIQSHGSQAIGEWTEDHPSHLYADYTERRDEWSMLHSNFTVKASSTLRPDGDIRYDPENIRDRREKNAWSEGADGPGIDEWLEITPVEPKPLLAIHIKPGYQKGDLFKANARPKTIRIELNGEHHFDAVIPDREEEVEIPISGYAKPVKKIRLTFTEVYPGSHFEDLCISRVMLHAKLDQEPDIQPAR